MNQRDPGAPLYAAIFGIPIAACVVFEVVYQIARRTSGEIFSDSVAYLLVGACTLVGVVLIQFHGSWTVRRRIIAAIVYFPTMYIVVLMVILFYMVLRGAVPLA